MTKMKIVGCHELGIRKDPAITEMAEEVIETVKATEVLLVDTERTSYSWDGKLFYYCQTPSEKNGYAIASALRPI